MDNVLLMGIGNPRIAGNPSVEYDVQFIPVEGEAPLAHNILSTLVARKGATVFVAEALADIRFTSELIRAAKVVVPRM